MFNQREIDVIKRMRPTVNKDEPIVIHSEVKTWSGSGATLAIAIAGAQIGDIVQATINSAPTEAAYLVSAQVTAVGVVTLTLSAANTSDDAIVAITLLR